MKVPLLDLGAQYDSIRDELRTAVDEVLESQRFIMGPKVERFEAHIAKYCGADHAIGVSSGTDALLVALMALGIGPGDAVLTTPYTFFATAGCIARLSATPVFVDIDPITFNIDPNAVRGLLKSWDNAATPRVILPVHLYGQCADMAPLLEVAREHSLAVIEDAAQAIGAEYPLANGIAKAGSMGNIGCFSFFPSKNLGGCGDGGMIITNDSALAEEARKLRNHGASPKYYHSIVGGNFRLDALQASVLDVKLQHLEEWHNGRRANAAYYDQAFADSPVVTPAALYAGQDVTNHHIYNQYVVRVPDRDKVKDALKQADIGCEIYYPVPMHIQECFRYLGCNEGAFPESERAAKETLALPIYPELTDDMRQHVAATLLEIVS